MADNDPLIPQIKYATFDTLGDGSTTSWEFNFAGGYISRDHVKAFTEDLVTGELRIIAPLNFVGPNTVNIAPAVPTGQRLVIYRDTPKSAPIVDYTEGSIVNERNLDVSNQQAVFIAAELADRVVADYDFSNALLYASTTATQAITIATAIDGKASQALTNSVTASTAAAAAVSNSTYQRTNGLARSVKDRVLETPSVKDWSSLQVALNNSGGAGKAQSELVMAPGDYNITAPSQGSGVVVQENTLIRGNGARVLTGHQNFRVFWSADKSNIRYDNLHVEATSTEGNDAMSAVYAEVGSNDLFNWSMTNSYLINTSWGALLQGQTGTGYFYGPGYLNNSVVTKEGHHNADGMHMVGRIIGGRSVGNFVYGRDDAALAFNGDVTNVGAGCIAAGNAHIDNLVGMDVSGQHYTVVSGMNLLNRKVRNASDPCFRAIKYTGSVPTYTMFSDLMAIGNHTGSGEFDGKVDSEGDDVFVSVRDVMLRSFWTNAKKLSVSGCHFLTPDLTPGVPGGLNLANYAGDISIGENHWDGPMTIIGPGNFGLAGAVTLAPQLWNKSIPAWFLPSYSAANPHWAGRWFHKGAVNQPVTHAATVVTATTPTDLPNSTFYVSEPCLLVDLVALTDNTTHSSHVSVVSAGGAVMGTYSFNVAPGAGGVDVRPGITGPVSGGGMYHPKLEAGYYKLQAWSDLNPTTIKPVSVRLWN